MYILFDNDSQKVITFEAKSDLATYIGVHWNTITNKFKASNGWDCKKGKVICSDEHYKRHRSGNKYDMTTRKSIIEGKL